MTDSTDLASLAAILRESDDYQVLERLTHTPVMGDAGGEPEGHGLVVDVETTGRDTRNDRIIQMAAVPFRFTRDSGRITTVDPAVVEFDDPGRGIPREVQALTGISDDDVRGTRLDEARFDALAEEADLIIAHNAGFDRPFVERRLAGYRNANWACTWAEVPWGPGSQTLEMLLFKQCRKFIDAHRADEDCFAVIELLAATLSDGRTAMDHLQESATNESVRVRAVSAPFEVKDLLKERGYRWWAGSPELSKCWFREIPVARRDEETAWLAESIYPAGRCRAEFDPLTAATRYRRMGE